MKYSVCTISFRHQLISLERIAYWAKAHQFDSIELWGVHAKNLKNSPDFTPERLLDQGLSVSMVSDYLPLDGDLNASLESAKSLCAITGFWGAKKLRTFSGSKPSAQVGGQERAAYTQRLREYCKIAADHGIDLVVETHPNTLADTLESTLRLIEEVNHPALRINFDVIHVWEMGSDPIFALDQLAPVIKHLHFKNITQRHLLDVFSPSNVYAPAGSREGMTPIFNGEYDFKNFLAYLMTHSSVPWQNMDASLEWFGPDVFATLDHDRQALAKLESQFCPSSQLEPSAVV
ncbi:MAG: sugar phosphate isomerase/epimerase [Bermanella sp.]